MIVDTPPIECYVKKSHLSGQPNFTKEDETVFGVLVGIRFVRNRAPLYIVYLPTLGAVYDKVDQNAIFNKPNLDFEGELLLEDVGWWDTISTNWQLIELKFFKNYDVEMLTRNKDSRIGTYLFTCDPQEPQHGNDYGESEIWHEHKTKTYFFDRMTGVLCCTPNNKMRIWSSSLTPEQPEDPSFLRVYHEIPGRITHEEKVFLGNDGKFFYGE